MPRPKKKATEEPVTIAEAITTSEPTEKPRLKFRSAVRNAKFDIFSASAAKQITKDLMAKVGKGSGFEKSSAGARDYLPVPWVALQYLIGRPGIPINTITEFIGSEGVGKSSLVYALMGGFITNNIPCYYINSEPKALEPDWQLRLLGSNPTVAKQVRDVIDIQSLNSLEEMDEHIRAWVSIKRDEENVPLDVPLVIVIDSITKLMNPEEFAATGLVKLKPGEKRKPEGASNVSQKPGVTAKWLHQWTRLITPVLDQKNVTIITVSGQNQNMDAGASPSYIPKSATNKRNKTRTGGEALNQSAALQFIVTYKGSVKNTAGDSCGKEICLFCAKNSYGPTAREIKYYIYDDRAENYKEDVEGVYHQQAIDMDISLASLLVDRKVLGISVTRKRYSSSRMDVYELSPRGLVEHITADPDLFKEVTTALSIKGYDYDEKDT